MAGLALPDHRRITTIASPSASSHADHSGMWLTVFRLRSVFIWCLSAVAIVAAVQQWTHPLVSIGLIVVVLPYNAVLQRMTRRNGVPPPAMAYGDQLLGATFVVLFPETLTAAMVAATFDLATAGLAFNRRTTLQAGGLGGLAFTVAMLAAAPDISFGTTALSAPSYGVAVLVMGSVVTAIAQREREARERSAALVGGLDAVVWELDVVNSRLTYVNSAVEELTGYSTRRWLDDAGLRIRSVHADDRDAVVRRIRQAAIDGIDYQHVCRLHHADGRLIWVRELVATEQDDRGRTVRLRGTAIDITEAREAQLALTSRSRQQLALVKIGDLAVRQQSDQALFAAVVTIVADVLETDLVHVLQYDGDRHEATMAAQCGWYGAAVGDRFACPPSSHIRFTVSHQAAVVYTDLHAEDRFTVMPELLAEGARSGMGVVIAGPLAPFGTLGVYSRRLRSFTPDEVLFVQSVANILAGVVARSDIETQLLQAQKMEAVGQLAGGMAHDFNNLLTAVLGYAELLVPSVEDDQDGQRALFELRNAGQRAAALVDQLLTFSRGRMRPRGPVDVNAVVASVQALLSRLLGEDIAVTTDIQPVEPVDSNVHQLEQLIVNLAVNARDAMPIGGAFSIATQTVDLDGTAATALGVKSGRYVRLVCADTGVGMDERTLQRAFEPFFTTKEAGKGTGLGLSTVYAIARNAGGQVDIHSAPGQGTSVSVWLPACDRTAEPDVAQPERSAEPTSGSESVLLVEDQATVQALLRQILEQQGYNVLVAADGNEALSLLAGGASAALMVTDVVMPQLSGPDLVALVLADHPAMRVLYISGYAEGADLPLAPAGTDFLHKPFGVSEFLSKVRGLLDGAAVPAA